MQAASDIFLGWQRTAGLDGVERDFYFRQLRDWKGSFGSRRCDRRASCTTASSARGASPGACPHG